MAILKTTEVTGSLSVQDFIYGELIGSSSYAATASYALNAGVTTYTEKFVLTGSAFEGNPKTYAITFVQPFSSPIYMMSVVGTDARIWSVVNSTSGSIINSNSNQVLSGFVYVKAEEI